MKIIIIGAGIAGVTCAKEIRNNSDTAEITLITGDTQFPYYRLNLTRYLAKEVSKDRLFINPQSWYDEKRIKLILGYEVTEINKNKNEIQLSDGTTMEYDKLIIANGAYPFIPPIPGSELGNVMAVRNLEDADFLFEKMEHLESCVCIGGGILGLEAAGAIANSGVKVTLLEGAPWIMPRQLNKKASEYLKKCLEEIGIEVKENVRIQEIMGKDHCEGVKLSTGEVVPTTLVIITAGVRPNVDLAQISGMEVNKGLVVNNQMQTSQENIFAAGDVTEHDGILYGLWNVAQQQGKIAAQNAVGMNTEFRGFTISNSLKLLGLDMFSIGEFMPVDGSCYEYEKETADSYISLVMSEGKIIGSNIIGDRALSVKVKQAVDKGVDFPHELYDDVESIINKLMS